MTEQPDEHTSRGLHLVGTDAAPSDPATTGSISPGSAPPGAPGARRPLLLATKLRAPPAYHNVVRRARLLGQLDQSLRRTVTVIAAPAGFGKTTLLGDWSRRTGLPIAWVSLDDGDNDPTRLWSYVIAALEQVHAGAGESALALLQSPQPPAIEAVLTVLINDLADLAGDVLLVLDDYHAIEAPAVHQAVTFLIDHLPSQVHLVLTTRAEPPLPLARWRARGQLLELGAADLRFRPDEAAAFLAESMDLHLTVQEAAQLAERTEGWITGLQLIALSLQKQEDVARFIRDLSGAQRFILDYLAEEVLIRQSESVQAFLLQTSILERLSGALCDAVTERTDCRALLVELERANLFLVPLDEERCWYRYHHLFAEFLRGRLQAQQQVATLHRRAARWYEAQGLPDDAIGHALAAAEYAEAAALIGQIGQERLMGGELTTLQRWLDRLPDDVVLAHPRLCLLRAWLVAFAFRAEQAERYLQAAEQAVAALTDEAERRSFLDEIVAVRTMGAATQVDVARLRELTNRAERQGSGCDDNVFLRSIRHLSLALALELSGDVAASHQAYRDLSASSQASGNVIVAVLALSQLGDQLVVQGHLHRAADTYNQALRLAEPGPAAGDRPAIPLAALGHFGLAQVLVEWDELDAAEAHIEAALAQAQQLANSLILLAVYLGLARLQQSRGDDAAALESLDRADDKASDSYLAPLMLAYTGTLRVRLWIRRGALSSVADWVERYRRGARQLADSNMYLLQMEAIGQAALMRALIALGRPREALVQTEPLYRTFEAAGLGGLLIELSLLEALARDALGEEGVALAALARSLARAAPEGYTRLYVDEGPSVARLLARLKGVLARQDGAALPAVPAAYLDRLLAACGRSGEQAAPPPSPAVAARPPEARQGSPLVEPLSEREREVLGLVAAGLTNQEIAAALVVELSTVKTHLLRLYGKLGVHSRTQALNRARELNLLP